MLARETPRACAAAHRSRARRTPVALLALGALVVPSACGREEARSAGERLAGESRPQAALGLARFPTLLNVRPFRTAPRSYDFMVMLSSPYDPPRRRADGWRILTLDGGSIAERRFGGRHPDGQPFWRRHSDVRVPRGVRTVRFEAHDARNGYGGRRLTVSLP
jgi:hypothetical protein